MISVDTCFDSGNALVESITEDTLRLAIRPDVGEEHFQWFHYRVTTTPNRAIRMVLTNAGDASYEGGWPGYRACASYDRKTWFRVPTSYANGELTITHEPEQPVIWYAYFAPYTYEQHQQLLGRCQERGAQIQTLGQTLDGRALDLVTAGEGVPIWIIGRQHPGESMAEWFIEGLLERLLDPSDALARTLLARCAFYIVPNMNPDGSVRGHLRTNAAGANLNREWAEPTMERSPEVFLVRDAMDNTGLRMCLDVHGDEALPYNFIAGPDGVDPLGDHVLPARDVYCAALERACPDFQNEYGYPRAPKGRANLTMATNQLASRFNALAMTLEMPFKDNKLAPDAEHGWSPQRCRQLGQAQLDAIAAVLDQLG